MFKGSNIHYELDGRDKGIACGGIGVIHTLAKQIGLVKEIDKRLHLLKRHVPYHESDHVLNLAYNVLAGGEGFEDIELLRQDEGWMDALGAEIIPDPTTEGDFVRRFSMEDVMRLMEVINERRKKVWEMQPKYEVKTQRRQRPENVKDQIVKARGFKKIETVSEQVAEFAYRPGKCIKTYRMVVLRKNLTVEKGEVVLFDEIRYFFYITNDTTMSSAEVVYFANDRCDHENDIEQLKNGVNALRMPSDDLVSNWAYMVIAALAWSLKAWVGLWMPNKILEKRIVRMEFKRFLNTFMKIPCLIVKAGRRITYRVVGYNRYLKDYLRAFSRMEACRVT